MKLSKPQLAALRMVALEPRRTTAHAHGDYIGGNTAASLKKLGLVQRTGELYALTAKGREVLASIDGVGAQVPIPTPRWIA